MHHQPDDQLLRRVHAEYLEMPGLSLTLSQARRLWQLDEDTCATVLDALIGSGFLTRTSTGTFRRLVDGRTAGELAHA
jgi:hypothetical protein